MCDQEDLAAEAQQEAAEKRDYRINVRRVWMATQGPPGDPPEFEAEQECVEVEHEDENDDVCGATARLQSARDVGPARPA